MVVFCGKSSNNATFSIPDGQKWFGVAPGRVLFGLLFWHPHRHSVLIQNIPFLSLPVITESKLVVSRKHQSKWPCLLVYDGRDHDTFRDTQDPGFVFLPSLGKWQTIWMRMKSPHKSASKCVVFQLSISKFFFWAKLSSPYGLLSVTGLPSLLERAHSWTSIFNTTRVQNMEFISLNKSKVL